MKVFLQDVYKRQVFHKIKKVTGETRIWMRAGISTLVSQFIDSYVVLIIAFYVGAKWPLAQVIAIGTVNYFYKVTLAILLLPAIYIMHYVIEKYLGKDLAEKMRTDAMEN